MAKMEKKKLGDTLVKKGVITSAQLTQALAEQKRTGERLGRVLVNLGFITEQEMIEFLGAQMEIPPINLDNYLIEPQIIDLVSPEPGQTLYPNPGLQEWGYLDGSHG